MDGGSAESPTPEPVKTSVQVPTTEDPKPGSSANDAQSPSGISTWAKGFKLPQSLLPTQDESSAGNKSTFTRFTSGIGLRLSPKASQANDTKDGSPTASEVTQPGFIGSLTKGIVDSSKNAVKAVQVKARHVVSQNKRRYQEGGFDLDMTYITENIIAMGFPAGDMSSGFFGYVEGFYRNHMEEVIKFFETHHKDKYKVYNLCSERLYDASLFEGKVASFPFDDHNCPPIHLITLFCQSAYAWLKEDIENVVVVHCKAGMARTGLMISSLLLYLKFFPTAEESIDYYNQKRCIDGKGLVLPSQIRYVKYFERVLTYFKGEYQPGRRCMLRGFRLHRCPYWIRPSITIHDHNGVLFSTKKHPRTKDLSPEEYWFSAPKKGVMVFALPGEPGLTELAGDFKVHFHDGQGDFYCWLNTTMIENRKVLLTGELDGFDKRKLPSPGFQVEIVLVDYNATEVTPTPQAEPAAGDKSSQTSPATPAPEVAGPTIPNKEAEGNEGDDVFSDNDDENKSKLSPEASRNAKTKTSTDNSAVPVSGLVDETKQLNLGKTNDATHGQEPKVEQSSASAGGSVFKAMAADASVFSFGDDDDDEDY